MRRLGLLLLLVAVPAGAQTARTTESRLREIESGRAKFKATGSTTARALRDRAADVVHVKDFGAKGDGTTDDTAALQAALIYARQAGRPIYVPPGTYRTGQLTLYTGMRLFGQNWNGSDPNYLDGAPGASILKAKDGTIESVILIPPAADYQRMIEIAYLGIVGHLGPLNTTGAVHGIYSAEPNPSTGSSHIWIHDVQISGVGGRGVYLKGEWHTSLERVDVNYTGDNAFDLGGGNTTLLFRTYAHKIKAGKAGYRIHQGEATLIAVNGIDASEATADWGVFGDNVAEDGRVGYFRGTLIGCNIEAFPRYGLRYKAGSVVSIRNTTFFSTQANSVAILHDGAQGSGLVDGATSFVLTGAGTWKDGYAVHINDASNIRPFWTEGYLAPDGYYNDNSASAGQLPNLRTSTTGGALAIYPLAIAPAIRQDTAQTNILGQWFKTATWDPPSIADGAVATTTVSNIPYAALGDPLMVGFTNAVPAGAILSAHMTSANTAQVTLFNKSGAPLDLAPGTLYVSAWKFNGAT